MRCQRALTRPRHEVLRVGLDGGHQASRRCIPRLVAEVGEGAVQARLQDAPLYPHLLRRGQVQADPDGLAHLAHRKTQGGVAGEPERYVHLQHLLVLAPVVQGGRIEVSPPPVRLLVLVVPVPRVELSQVVRVEVVQRGAPHLQPHALAQRLHGVEQPLCVGVLVA